MALHKMFAVLDVKANAFSPPFTAHTTGLATRMFTDAANDPNSTINKYPSDFRLGLIGTFDDNNGQLAAETITWLGFATDYIRNDDDQRLRVAPRSAS